MITEQIVNELNKILKNKIYLTVDNSIVDFVLISNQWIKCHFTKSDNTYLIMRNSIMPIEKQMNIQISPELETALKSIVDTAYENKINDIIIKPNCSTSNAISYVSDVYNDKLNSLFDSIVDNYADGITYLVGMFYQYERMLLKPMTFNGEQLDYLLACKDKNGVVHSFYDTNMTDVNTGARIFMPALDPITFFGKILNNRDKLVSKDAFIANKAEDLDDPNASFYNIENLDIINNDDDEFDEDKELYGD